MLGTVRPKNMVIKDSTFYRDENFSHNMSVERRWVGIGLGIGIAFGQVGLDTDPHKPTPVQLIPHCDNR